MSDKQPKLISQTLPNSFRIGDVVYSNHVEEDLSINSADLSSEFAEHPKKLAWYSTAYELALSYETKLKNELARLGAQLDARVREDAAMAGVKLTEGAIRNTVITAPQYALLEDQYREAGLQTGLLKAARDAMIQRRDMLVGLGANYRAEGRADIFMSTLNKDNT